jgi:hypothetical protein
MSLDREFSLHKAARNWNLLFLELDDRSCMFSRKPWARGTQNNATSQIEPNNPAFLGSTKPIVTQEAEDPINEDNVLNKLHIVHLIVDLNPKCFNNYPGPYLAGLRCYEGLHRVVLPG